MFEPIPYSALLVVHLLAIALFVAGLALVAGSLPGLSALPAIVGAERLELFRLRRMNRYVATPALLVLWLCGIAMTVKAGWYDDGWLHAKIALVVILSGLHGYQMRSLRRLANGARVRSPGYGMLAIIALFVIVIGALVVAKPF